MVTGQDTAAEAGDYLCTVPGCSKRFKRKEHLARHAVSHTTVRPFVCHVCDKSFLRSDVLKRHLRQHGDEALHTAAAGSTLNACDACHTRKAKCSGGDPCEFCLKNGMQCSRNRAVTRHRATRKAQKDRFERPVSSQNAADQAMQAPDPSRTMLTVQDENASESDQLLDISVEQNQSRASDSGGSPFAELPFSLPIGITDSTAEPVFIDPSILGLPKTDLRNVLDRSPYQCGMSERTIDSLISSYFLRLYQRWPLIHPLSFKKHEANPHLLWTMVMVGGRCKPFDKGCQTLAEVLRETLFEAIVASLLSQAHFELCQTTAYLSELQAAAIYVIYSLYFGNDEHVQRAEQVNNGIITMLQSLGAYHPQVWTKEIPWTDPLSSEWVAIETRKRLTTVSFLSHVYISILLGKSPTMDYRLLNSRLPCRNSWWWVMCPHEMEALRMNTKERSPKPVSMFIENTLATAEANSDTDLGELEVVDCHLIQCAMYSLILNNSKLQYQHQYQVHGQENFVSLPITLTTDAWENNLDFWRTQADSEFWRRQTPAVLCEELKPRTILETVNLILYHYSMIQLHCPLSVIISVAEQQRQQSYFNHATNGNLNTEYGYRHVEFPHEIQTWSQTASARLAAFHAGQIFFQYRLKHTFSCHIGPDHNPPNRRIFAHKPETERDNGDEKNARYRAAAITSINIGIEPLPKPLLYHSVLLLWAFTYHRIGCHSCIKHELRSALLASSSAPTPNQHHKPHFNPNNCSIFSFNPAKMTLQIDHPSDNDFVLRWIGATNIDGIRNAQRAANHHDGDTPVGHQRGGEQDAHGESGAGTGALSDAQAEAKDGLMRVDKFVICRCQLAMILEFMDDRILREVEELERGDDCLERGPSGADSGWMKRRIQVVKWLRGG